MDERPLDLAVLKTFSPLDGLKAENLHALARKTHMRELGAERFLFKEGDTDKRTFYLVAASVELRADDRLIGTIRAGTPEARAALAPGLPRKFTARAAIDLEYIMIDSDLLDVLLTWDQDRKSTRLNSSHLGISYAVFCLKKKNNISRNDDVSSPY